MTRRSIREYAAAVRGQYLRGSRVEKRAMLDEFCKVTGYHCKSAIRLLHHVPSAPAKRPGRHKEYGSEFVLAIKVAWEATDCVCSKPLAPFVGQLVPILEGHGELQVSEAVRSQLMQVSASTIDRVLKPLPSEASPWHPHCLVAVPGVGHGNASEAVNIVMPRDISDQSSLSATQRHARGDGRRHADQYGHGHGDRDTYFHEDGQHDTHRDAHAQPDLHAPLAVPAPGAEMGALGACAVLAGGGEVGGRFGGFDNSANGNRIGASGLRV